MTASLPLVELAKNNVTSYLQHGGIAIDATMENSFDTVFLVDQLTKNEPSLPILYASKSAGRYRKMPKTSGLKQLSLITR